MKSASDGENILPRVDNFFKIPASIAKKIRGFAKATKIFSLWWRWEFVLFFIFVFYAHYVLAFLYILYGFARLLSRACIPRMERL